MSAVQVALLMAHVARRTADDEEREIREFEHNLLINSPEMYLQFQKTKRLATQPQRTDYEDLPVDTVEWRMPKNKSEIAAFERELAAAEAAAGIGRRGSDEWLGLGGTIDLDDLEEMQD